MTKRLLPLLAVLLWGGSVYSLQAWQEARGYTEYLSVPPARTARALGAGFDNIAADSLYVQFIAYFGRHMKRDGAFFNMAPVLEVITDLDPHFHDAYFMGAMALGDNGQIQEAEALLAKAPRANPTSWRAWYDAGMGLFLVGNGEPQYLRAAGWFKRAAELGGPPEARFMEARMYDVTGRKTLLAAAWLDTYRHAPGREAREVALHALQRLGVRVPSDNPQR